jgi:hypothetical protein
MISSSSRIIRLFFRTNWRRLGDILKKCSETTQRLQRNGGFKAAAKDAILSLLK